MTTWGATTQDGHLLAFRNLDWSSDTGISGAKALTFWVPDEGYAHVTVGYLGFLGALSGMNEKGIVTGEVGSTGALERIQGEPWTIKHRDILQSTGDLDEALSYLTNTAENDFNRPQTIGYNWLVTWGDPDGNGVDAHGAIAETNAIFTAVHHQDHDCTPEVRLYEYDEEGKVDTMTSNSDDVHMANLEQDAVEIDAQGEIKLFQVDEDGAFVIDENGKYIPDPTGKPLSLGKTLSCAVFRGDEAMCHGVRRWQEASHGPYDNPDGLMIDSGSYKSRYLRIHDMLNAYRTGTSYELDGTVLIPDNGGTPVPMTINEAVNIASAAAMSSNIYSVAYDATDLVMRVAFEKGTGDTWVPASKCEYVTIKVAPLFDLLK